MAAQACDTFSKQGAPGQFLLRRAWKNRLRKDDFSFTAKEDASPGDKPGKKEGMEDSGRQKRRA
jgi:hypothetical protein